MSILLLEEPLGHKETPTKSWFWAKTMHVGKLSYNSFSMFQLKQVSTHNFPRMTLNSINDLSVF